MIFKKSQIKPKRRISKRKFFWKEKI